MIGTPFAKMIYLFCIAAIVMAVVMYLLKAT